MKKIIEAISLVVSLTVFASISLFAILFGVAWIVAGLYHMFDSDVWGIFYTILGVFILVLWLVGATYVWDWIEQEEKVKSTT